MGVHRSFEWEGQLTVDHFEDGNTAAQNSLGRPNTQSGGLSADEFPCGQLPGAYNTSFFGQSTGLVARPGPPTRTLRLELGGQDLTRREVWLRVTEVYTGSLPPGATGFQLGLEDARGTVAWVDSDAVGGVPRPYPRPSRVKSMLGTLRFRADCFRAGRRLDLRRVQALLIRCDRRDERALAFDDVQVVKS